MLKLNIDIDDADEINLAIVLLQDILIRKEKRDAEKKIEFEKSLKERKEKRPKKTVDELLKEINDELDEWVTERDDAQMNIDELNIKKDELKKRVKKVVPTKKAKKEKDDKDGTIRFLIDETIKRTEMDKEIFNI